MVGHNWLSLPKTIAVVGLSDNPTRYSYQVAEYLVAHGFTVIPVNPNLSQVFGRKSYPNVSDIPGDIPVDIVDIFRRPEAVPEVIANVIASGRKPTIWMQEGVVSPEGKRLAQEHGMDVLMDVCLMKTHKKMPYP